MLPWRGLSVCMYDMSSVILVHPAKAVGRNEMPFGRDNRVVQVIGASVPHGEERFGVGIPQFSAMSPIAILVWLLLYIFSSNESAVGLFSSGGTISHLCELNRRHDLLEGC